MLVWSFFLMVPAGPETGFVVFLAYGSPTVNRPNVMKIGYASWGPLFWPFLRSSARAPIMKAVSRKGT